MILVMSRRLGDSSLASSSLMIVVLVNRAGGVIMPEFLSVVLFVTMVGRGVGATTVVG